MPVVLYLRGLYHLHLSRPAHLKTSYPAIKTPRKLYASWPRAPAVNAEQKDHLAFLLTRRKGEQRTAMPRRQIKGRRGEGEREQASRGKETAPAWKEKSAKVRQERTKEEIEADCRMKREKKERKTERERE